MLLCSAVRYSVQKMAPEVIQKHGCRAHCPKLQIGVRTDEKGRYFIDRDGRHFCHILNFLRDGNLSIEPVLLISILSELRAEARFFQLSKLEAYLEEASLSSKCALTPRFAPKVRGSCHRLVPFVGVLVLIEFEIFRHRWSSFVHFL